MICTTCGATLDRTDTACPVCAAPVVAEASSETSRPTSGPSPSPSQEPREDASVGAGPMASVRSGSSALGDQRALGSGGPGGPGSGGPGSGGPGGPGSGPAGWQPMPTHPSGLSSEARGWGIAAHLLGLGGALLTVVTLGFAGPLIVWLLKRDDHPFIEHHAKESLNFQLTALLALVVATVAAIPIFLLGFLTLGVLWLIALIVVVAATVVWFVFPIVGAVRASNGEGYRYPVCIRFVR